MMLFAEEAAQSVAQYGSLASCAETDWTPPVTSRDGGYSRFPSTQGVATVQRTTMGLIGAVMRATVLTFVKTIVGGAIAGALWIERILGALDVTPPRAPVMA